MTVREYAALVAAWTYVLGWLLGWATGMPPWAVVAAVVLYTIAVWYAVRSRKKSAAHRAKLDALVDRYLRGDE
jgi:hypothetical protein